MCKNVLVSNPVTVNIYGPTEQLELPPLPPNSATFWQPPIALPTSSSAKEKEVEDTVANDTANLGINTGRAPQQPSRPGHPWRLVKPCSYIDLPPHPLRPPQRLPPPTVHPLLSQLRSRLGLPPAQRLPPPVPPKPRNLGINNHGRALQQPSREDLDSLEDIYISVRPRFTRNLQSVSQSQLPRQLTKLERKFRWQRKEVAWDPNAVYVHHLAEFLRGETAVDSSCTNGDLLCFALHMIMMDSGYQPSVSLAWLLEQIVYSSSPWLSFAVGCCYCHTTHPRHLL